MYESPKEYGKSKVVYRGFHIAYKAICPLPKLGAHSVTLRVNATDGDYKINKISVFKIRVFPTPKGCDRMKEGNYRRMLAWVNSRKGLAKFSVLSGKIITLFVYLFYPLFLIHLIATKNPAGYKYLIIPAVSFVVLSLVRYFLNLPRPYEKLNIKPLYPKSTRGKSFPSRHTFCAFIIAVATFYIYPAVGVVIAVSGIILAISRVLCGVHFIRDVLAGMVCGVGFGIIGFYLL